MHWLLDIWYDLWHKVADMPVLLLTIIELKPTVTDA
jgi:hypothetical protein